MHTPRSNGRISAFRPIHRALSAAALSTGVALAQAQIYVGTSGDDSSSVTLSNFVSEATPRLLIGPTPAPADETPAITLAPTRTLRQRAAAPSPHIAALIEEVALQVGLSKRLLQAVAAHESNFDASAVSPKGAIGVMQLLPATARRFGARRPFDPRENILAGAHYLRWLANLFDNRLDLMLAAYNAGEQTVLRAGRRVPAIDETRVYVARILAALACVDAATCKA